MDGALRDAIVDLIPMGMTNIAVDSKIAFLVIFENVKRSHDMYYICNYMRAIRGMLFNLTSIGP